MASRNCTSTIQLHVMFQIRTELNNAVYRLADLNAKYKFGDITNKSLGVQLSIQVLEEQLMNTECYLPEGGECFGIDMALGEYMSDALGLVYWPSQVNANNPFLLRINSMQEPLLDLLFQNSDKMTNFFEDKFDLLLVISYVFYIIAIALVLLMYVALTPLQSKVKIENAR